MNAISLGETTVQAVEFVDYTLILKLTGLITLSGLMATLEEFAEPMGDARAVLLSFERGGFGRVAVEFDCLGESSERLSIQRLIPVAWVVDAPSLDAARRQAYRFATWGRLRGSFVGCAPALEWLQRESPAGRLAMP